MDEYTFSIDKDALDRGRVQGWINELLGLPNIHVFFEFVNQMFDALWIVRAWIAHVARPRPRKFATVMILAITWISFLFNDGVATTPPEKQSQRTIESGCTGDGTEMFEKFKHDTFELPAFPNSVDEYVACNDLKAWPIAAYGRYAVVQIQNRFFCDDDYCQTYVYDYDHGGYIIALQARRNPLVGVHGRIDTGPLKNFHEHKFEVNNVLAILNLKNGALVITEVFGRALFIQPRW